METIPADPWPEPGDPHVYPLDQGLPPAHGRALVPVHAIALQGAPPAVQVAGAQEAAVALQSVIAKKPRKLEFNGRQYVEFEDWQLVGHFYGVTAAAVGEPEYVAYDVDGATVWGFRATAIALHNGREASRATAMCMSDEEKWGKRNKYEYHYVLRDGSTSADDPGADNIEWEDNPKKPGKRRPVKVRVLAGQASVPLFQIASMAQTRAAAKALRNVLSWVVALAGYGTTPAEELDDKGHQGAVPPRAAAPPALPASHDDTLAAAHRGVPAPSKPRPAAAARVGERSPAVAGGSKGPLGPEPPPVGDSGEYLARERHMDDPFPNDPHWQPTEAQGTALLHLLDECGFTHYRGPGGERRCTLPAMVAAVAGLPGDFALRAVKDGVQWLALTKALLRQRDHVKRPGAAGGAELPVAAKTSPGGGVVHPHQDGAAASRSGPPAAGAAPGPNPKQEDVPF